MRKAWAPRKRVRAARPSFPGRKKAREDVVEEAGDAIKAEAGVKIEPEAGVEEEAAREVKSEAPEEAPEEVPEEAFKNEAPYAKEPPNWRLFVDKVREMRAMRKAPVDTMGCFESVPQDLEPKTKRFQHLIALMLSSQTKDEVTSAAVARLRDRLHPTLVPQAVVDTSEADLAALILPVGFYRRKAQYLRQTCAILLEKYDGDVPPTIKEMVALPGVGPKMAHLLMQNAWNESAGIGVDTHVFRLAQWWRWVPKTAHPTPEKTRIALEQWLPRELWAEINPLLVGFGQTWCPPKQSAAKCQECLLRTMCPASLAKK